MKKELYKEIVHGRRSRSEYWATVEDGKLYCESEADGYAYLRKGPESRKRLITLDELDQLCGCCGEAEAELKRQQELLKGK